MRKFIIAILAVLSSTAALASGQHTGFCRYGEECGGIVSQNLRQAQAICAREPFDKLALAVRQEQADGSIVFIGYTCVPYPGGY